MNEKQKHLIVADQYQDLAQLIGKRKADSPLAQQGLGLTSQETELVDTAERIREGITYVAVAGTVSAGKTTLINALVDTKLAVGTQAKTGVITEVSYGTDLDTVEVVYADDTTTQMSVDDFVDFSSLPLGSIKTDMPFPLPEHLINVSHASVKSNSSLNKHGIVFIDTLGFNAGKLAADTTSSYLKANRLYLPRSRNTSCLHRDGRRVCV